MRSTASIGDRTIFDHVDSERCSDIFDPIKFVVFVEAVNRNSQSGGTMNALSL